MSLPQKEQNELELISACKGGDLKTVRRLSSQVTVRDVRDHNGWSLLGIAARSGRLDVVRYLVTEAQCDPNVGDKYGSTPLYWASWSGHLDVVRYLVTEAQCVPNVGDKVGWTPLHWASRNGHLDLVRYLVTVAQCDPNVVDNDGQTPLHWASRNGHLDLVRCLVTEAQCDPNVGDNDGQTPLHWASRYGRQEVVQCLLAECHADPNCTTGNGTTPLSLARSNTEIIRLLLRHGAVPTDLYQCSSLLPDGSPWKVAQSTISVFMVGDKGAGKTTLTKALTTEKASIVRWTGRLSKVSGVKERTAGIECHTTHSSRIGHLSLHDCAGHGEFHNAHDTVIRSSMSALALGMFLFVVHLGACLEDLKQTVSYWLSFIQSQVCMESSAPVAKPYLLAVGSHSNSVKTKQELEEKERIVQSFCQDAENVDFVDYVTVDCRYSESPSLTQLRAHILATHDKLQKRVPRVSFQSHCFHIYLVSECGDKAGLQLGSLMKTIESDPLSSREKFLPQTLEALHEACSNLNRRGVTLYIQTQSIESSWIIIDKDMLLREVNGSVFAPADFAEHKSLTQTGVVPFSKIQSSFPQFDQHLITDFLVHMEFCREIREEDLLKLVTETHTEYGRERHFLFPALTQQSPPRDLWQPQPHQYSCCWVLQCLEQHYLNPRFQQVLQLRLAFEHSQAVEAHKVVATSPVLHQQCSLWRNGIKWSTDSSDVLVETSYHSVALYLSCRSEVSERSEQLELVNTRAQVIAQILKAKAEFCGSVKTVEEFVPRPQYPVTIPCPSGISVENIAQAICGGRKKVHISAHTLIPVSELLCFEPFQFCTHQCLVDLYSKDHLSHNLTSSFIDSFSSNITSVDDFCTLLNVPLHKVAVDSSSSDYHKAVRKLSEGTYQWLRQQMDKYSIFSGRNILEVANVSQDTLPPPSAAAPSSHGKLDSRPTLQVLQALPTSKGDINVIEATAVQWKTVGTALSISTDRIEIIQADNPHRVEQACLQMLQWWMDHHTPSWRALLRALRVARLNVLAHDIETALNQ